MLFTSVQPKDKIACQELNFQPFFVILTEINLIFWYQCVVYTCTNQDNYSPQMKVVDIYPATSWLGKCLMNLTRPKHPSFFTLLQLLSHLVSSSVLISSSIILSCSTLLSSSVLLSCSLLPT